MPVDPKLVVYHGPGSLWGCEFGKMREVVRFIPKNGGRDCKVEYIALSDKNKRYCIDLPVFARQAVNRLIPKR